MTLIVRFSTEDTAGIRPETLTLYDISRGEPVPTAIDLTGGTATGQIRRLGIFALVGETTHTYFPVTLSELTMGG